MKKEQIVTKILEFSPFIFNTDIQKIYNVITDSEWDSDKLNKQSNLTLHIIWRYLKHETEKNSTISKN